MLFIYNFRSYIKVYPEKFLLSKFFHCLPAFLDIVIHCWKRAQKINMPIIRSLSAQANDDWNFDIRESTIKTCPNNVLIRMSMAVRWKRYRTIFKSTFSVCSNLGQLWNRHLATKKILPNFPYLTVFVSPILTEI